MSYILQIENLEKFKKNVTEDIIKEYVYGKEIREVKLFAIGCCQVMGDFLYPKWIGQFSILTELGTEYLQLKFNPDTGELIENAHQVL